MGPKAVEKQEPELDQEKDVQLQKFSLDLISDVKCALPTFIWDGPKIRRRVRFRDTEKIVGLLEPFQENPQLLDPHLESFIPKLANAFLITLSYKFPDVEEKHAQHFMSLSRGICKLLYTFCKIRGRKVIVRFLNTETKNLELLLSSIEAGNPKQTEPSQNETSRNWAWEERYIGLLWLSHLFLAPFDLASISSEGTSALGADLQGLKLPENTPAITLRAVAQAVDYLSVSGKEMEAACLLLVRIAVRKDMQEIGVLDSLVKWAISILWDDNPHSTYYYIGILSFLAGVLNSSLSTKDMDQHAFTIFQTAVEISTADRTAFKEIRSSAVARKLTIKILRTTALLSLQNPTAVTTEIVETVIGLMFEAAGDPATPVRIGASKSLSSITLKLAPDMAGQVIDEILAALQQNVSWVSDSKVCSPRLDVSRVNPSEWHGLTLTLAHLLHRHVAPRDNLVHIISSLLQALKFEQRSSSGSSIGTNVRDAACFGVWSLAKRYMTDELIKIGDQHSLVHNFQEASVIKALAKRLIVSASLDPSGNIRRASSAALQELVGRHPNIIDHGIELVQIVDYHAVAVRSRAVREVAVTAAGLSESYAFPLIEGLLDWRGMGDFDDSARRTSADVLGYLISIPDEGIEYVHWKWFDEVILRVDTYFGRPGVTVRQVEERHGLLLSLAIIIENLGTAISKEPTKSLKLSTAPTVRDAPTRIIKVVEEFDNLPNRHSMGQFYTLFGKILNDKSFTRRPELTSEAICRLITATLRLPSIAVFLTKGTPTDEKVIIDENSVVFDITIVQTLIETALSRIEPEVISASSEAAAALLSMLDNAGREGWVQNWIDSVKNSYSGQSGKVMGYIHALFLAYPSLANFQDIVNNCIHQRWDGSHSIEVRVTILKCLSKDDILDKHGLVFARLIAEGLDDYTTDTRGDVGSLVRIEASKAAARLWRNIDTKDKTETLKLLFGKVLRLAAEKMDKVRIEAYKAVLCVCKGRDKLEALSPSSEDYFHFLLKLSNDDSLINVDFEPHRENSLFEGYVSSADTGSEDLVRASRAALAKFCQHHGDHVCATLLDVLSKNVGNDRISISTLEVMSHLFDTGVMQKSSLDWKRLHNLVQRVHYKTSNMRKLEASLKVYGGMSTVYLPAMVKLTDLLLHPYPKVRNDAADTIFGETGAGKGVNWLKAKKADVERLRKELGLKS